MDHGFLSFAEFLREHSGGESLAAISDKWKALVAAVRTEKRGGSITVVVKVKKDNNIDVLVKHKMPGKPVRAMLHTDGPSIRNDKRQIVMFHAEVK